MEQKAFFIIFNGLSVVWSYLRPKSGSLSSQEENAYKVFILYIKFHFACGELNMH